MSSKGQHVTADGYAYLTKRTLVSKGKAAVTSASTEAMKIMGYVIVAEYGWVVHKNAVGTTERIEKIPGAELLQDFRGNPSFSPTEEIRVKAWPSKW